MDRLIDLLHYEFAPCMALGFAAGAVLAGTVMGVRAVVRFAVRAFRK